MHELKSLFYCLLNKETVVVMYFLIE